MESSLELSPSASSLRGRGFCRGGHHAPRLAGSFEPGLAASRRGRLRVLHGELSRALTFGLFVARPRLPSRGPSRPAAGGLLRAWCSGFSPQTASRPSWRALSSSRLRPLRCEAEASAARNIASRGWRAPSSLSSGFSPRTPSRPSWRALSSSHLRPLRCEAEASAAGAITPRGWRAHSSLV